MAMSSATDWTEGSNWFTVVIAIHHSGAATMTEDLLEYDKLLLDQLSRIEDTINKFAIQNYAAAGAVLAAYLSFGQAKFPGWVAVMVVLMLGITFALALARYLRRLKVLYGIHRTVVDCWFNAKSRSELHDCLRADEVSKTFFGHSDGPRRRKLDRHLGSHNSCGGGCCPVSPFYMTGSSPASHRARPELRYRHVIGPRIGAQDRPVVAQPAAYGMLPRVIGGLMVALPTRHRERPHPVGAHVAERHWWPGQPPWPPSLPPAGVGPPIGTQQRA
jgi:hypothetical protein